MNSSISTRASNNEYGWQVCASSQRIKILGYGNIARYPRGSTVVEPLAYLLRLCALAAVLNFLAAPVFAGPRIDISFEADGATDSQKLVHARALFAAQWPVVYDVFNCITDYPMLHEWIRESTLVSSSGEGQEFLVEFKFPWPVGSQWSRVAVTRNGKTISWKQVSGTLKANHGRIRFTSADNEVQIDYRAAIDIGLPELWTRSYKEKFIREFLTAAYEQTRSTAASPTTFVLAAER